MDSQGALKRELQQLPKAKEKASGQPVRSQGMAGTSTARGQGWLQGRLELQDEDRLNVWVVRSSRTSSPKTPSLWPLRCTNASHQCWAGGWNALELPPHGNSCAAGTYLPPTKAPREAPRGAMGPSMCSHGAVPALGPPWLTASSSRAPAGYQALPGLAQCLQDRLGQLRRDEVPSNTHRY